MKAVSCWVIVCAVLLLAVLLLRPLPTSYQGAAIFLGIVVANLAMIIRVMIK